MSILSGLLNEAKHIKNTLEDVFKLQHQISGRMNTMSEKGDALKAKIAEIGADVVEIDGDLDEIIAKVNEVTGLPTAAEWEEISGMLTSTKEATAAAAAKVPEPPPSA